MKTSSTLNLTVFVACILLAFVQQGNSSSREITPPTEVGGEDCDELEKKGKDILKECKCEEYLHSNDTNLVVDSIRCFWADLKKIKVVTEAVEQCDKRYPEEHGVPLCELKTIICACKLLDMRCPELKNNVNKGTAASNNKEEAAAADKKEEASA